MYSAELRVEGDPGLLLALVNDLAITVETQWKQGQLISASGTHSTNGFCATIAEARNPGKFANQLRDFIGAYDKFLQGKDRARLSGEITVGLTVREPGQDVASVLLGAADMRRLGQSNLSLRVAAFPASD